MKFSSTCYLGLAVGIVSVGAIPSRFLPEHARGGLAAATMPHLLPPAPGAGSTKHLLTVPLDHFDSSSSSTGPTMQVKYYVDDSHFDKSDPTAPIFVEMGGEGACGGASCGATCRAHKALAVSVEHRFYGESQPAGDRTDANLRFLSVEQNLADTAAVVDAVQLQYSSSSSSSAAAWRSVTVA